MLRVIQIIAKPALICLLLLGCNKPNSAKSSENNTINIIYTSNAIQKEWYYYDTGNKIEKFLELKTQHKSDTITLRQNYLEFYTKSLEDPKHPKQPFNFVAFGGDSITVSDYNILIKTKGNKKGNSIRPLKQYVNEKIYDNSISAESKLRFQFPFVRAFITEPNFSDLIKKFIETQSEKAFNDLQLEKRLLDSLHLKNLIDENRYVYYIDEIDIREALLNSIDFTPRNRRQKAGKPLIKDTAIYKYMLSRDSLIRTREFRNYLLTTLHGDYTDSYIQLYNKVAKNSILKSKSKDFLYTNILHSIVKEESINIRDSMLNVLRNDLVDTTYFVQFKRYLNPSNINQNLALIRSKDNMETTLKDEVAKYKNRVILVDFWASWCSPCLYQMPYSKKLEKKFGNENLIFMFISKDKDDIAWRKAASRLNLPKETSYLIDDTKISSFIAEYEIQEIPRYILINKSSQIVHPRAPRPSEKAMSDLIDKLLDEN